MSTNRRESTRQRADPRKIEPSNSRTAAGHTLPKPLLELAELLAHVLAKRWIEQEDRDADRGRE